MSGGVRLRLLALLVVGVALALLLARRVDRSSEERGLSPSPSPIDAPTAAPPAPPAPEIAAPQPEAPPADSPVPPLGDEVEGSWAGVDLEAVRRALPDNLYWETSVPTDDPRELERRAEEREAWNRAYGKVLSNTATQQEIEAYYAHRQRVSEDAIEFANHLLNHYGEELPARDVGLLELAIELHLARLEEIPRQIAEAHERREAHEAARQAWLEEQAAFETGEGADEPTAP